MNVPFPRHQIAALLEELRTPDWPPEQDTTRFRAIFDQFMQFITPVEFSFEPEENEAIIQVLTPSLHHADWKLRTCALLFLAAILNYRIGVSDTLAKSEPDRYRKLPVLLWDQFWKGLDDPHPRVVDYLARYFAERSDPIKHSWSEEALLPTLGAAIVRIRSTQALSRFLKPIGYYIDAYLRCVTIERVDEALFPLIADGDWEEGAQMLLLTTIEILAIANADYERLERPPTGLMNQLAWMLEVYFDATTERDLPILEALVQLNRRYALSEAFTLEFSPTLHAAFEHLGAKIVQQENTTIREFFLGPIGPILDKLRFSGGHLTYPDFMFPIHGMLKTVVRLQKRDWALEILSVLLETYPKYWSSNKNQIPEPTGSPNFLREAYQDLFPNSRMKPLDSQVGLPFVPLKDEDSSDAWLNDYVPLVGVLDYPVAILYLLMDTLLRRSVDPRFLAPLLEQLYHTHGIWLLRVLVHVLDFTVHFVEEPLPYLQQMGELWRHSSLSSLPLTVREDGDFPILLAILRACTPAPLPPEEGTRYTTDPATPAPLRELLVRLTTRTTRYAVLSILENLEDPYDVPALISRLVDLEDAVRCAAAMAMGRLGDLRAVPALISRLEDSEGAVRWCTMEALTEIGPPAVEALIKALSDPNERLQGQRLRGRVVEVLGTIGIPAVEALLVALRDSERGVCRYAAEALGTVGDPRAVGPLLAVLRDPEWGVRATAAEALGTIGDPRAVGPLLAALRDPTSWVRERAAEALGTMGNPRAVDPLLVTLSDPIEGVRERAARALSKIGTSTVEALLVALNDPDWKVRLRVAKVLGEIRDLRTVEPLLAALTDSNWWVQWHAVEALGKIGAPAMAPLLTTLSDPNTRLQRRVVEALGKIGDPRAVPALIPLLKDSRNAMRKAAAAALDQLDWTPPPAF